MPLVAFGSGLKAEISLFKLALNMTEEYCIIDNKICFVLFSGCLSIQQVIETNDMYILYFLFASVCIPLLFTAEFYQ